MGYHRIKSIETERKAVKLTLDNGNQVDKILSTTALNRIEALILDDLGIDWEMGAYGPEVEVILTEIAS